MCLPGIEVSGGAIDVAQEHRSAPEMEKGILGETDKTRRRPGGVSIKNNWSLRRGLAIDVAVICPSCGVSSRQARTL